jgi:hypothetical protein
MKAQRYGRFVAGYWKTLGRNSQARSSSSPMRRRLPRTCRLIRRTDERCVAAAPLKFPIPSQNSLLRQNSRRLSLPADRWRSLVINRFKYAHALCRRSFLPQARGCDVKNDAEVALDEVYVVRTTVAEVALNQTATVTAYKQLSTAGRAFRSLKTVDLEAAGFACCGGRFLAWSLSRRHRSPLTDHMDVGGIDLALRDGKRGGVRRPVPRQSGTIRCVLARY